MQTRSTNRETIRITAAPVSPGSVSSKPDSASPLSLATLIIKFHIIAVCVYVCARYCIISIAKRDPNNINLFTYLPIGNAVTCSFVVIRAVLPMSLSTNV